MKETKIAKENVEIYDLITDKYKQDSTFCQQHKQTCQRWLEFLESFDLEDMDEVELSINSEIVCLDYFIEKEMKDKKQAIEVYEKNGI